MRYENNEYLRRWLFQGGAYEYASLAYFDFEDRALEAATAEVQQQHPYLSAPEAHARAAYRLLTTHRRAPGEVVAPLRARLVGVARRNGWRAAKVAWAVAVLAALLLLATRAKAEPPRDLPPGVRAAVLARGLFAQQSSGLIVQFQNQGSVLSTRPAGLVVLNCSTNMSCSLSGSTFTLTSSSTASTAFSAITTGTNTSALTMGTGGTFTFSGTGIVNANQYKGGNASGTGNCGANLFVTALADAASPTCTQPSFSNLSGAASSGQVPHALLSAFHTDTTAASVVRGDLIAGIGASPTWQRVARGGTNGYPKWNSSGDLVASSGAAAGTGACTNQFVRAENADAGPTCNSVAGTDFANQNANLIFAGPSSGGAAAPTFRASVKADSLSTVVYTDQANTWTAGAQDMGGAASYVVPKAAGAAPTAQGDLRYDTTQDAFSVGGRGTINGKLPRVLSAQFSTTDNLVCSTIGTTETAFATSFQIPANFWKANKVVRVSVVWGYTSSASNPTLQVKMRVQKSGPTNVVLFDSGANFGPASATNLGFGDMFLIQGTAAPGTAVSLETGVVGVGGGVSQFSGNQPNQVAQGVNADTTAAQTIQFTLTCGASTAGNSVRIRQLLVEELN